MNYDLDNHKKRVPAEPDDIQVYWVGCLCLGDFV